MVLLTIFFYVVVFNEYCVTYRLRLQVDPTMCYVLLAPMLRKGMYLVYLLIENDY